MSETDDGERRKRRELKQRRKEKKQKRKAEKLLQRGTLQQQLPSTSTTLQQTETEEEVKSRRKKEKKEAKMLGKHKEVLTAGQKAASNAGTLAKEAVRSETAPSKPKESEGEKSRKRKSRTAEGASDDIRRNNDEAKGAKLPSPALPLQQDVGGAHQGHTTKKPRTDVTSSAYKPPRVSMQAQIDRVVSRKGDPSTGQRDREVRNQRGARSVDRASPSQSGSLATSTREGTLEDALHLSHKEMLVDRLYHSNQLKWLQEERGLRVKSGKFSQWEKERIQEAIGAFKAEQHLSDEDFISWLFGDKKGKEDKDLYNTFWKSITARLENRPNRAVRIAVRRSLQPDAMRGTWSEAENERLRSAVEVSGKNWSAVANAVGTRTAEDCRLRWRNHAPEIEARRTRGRFQETGRENLAIAVQTVCEEAGLDPMSLDTKIPWKRVAEELGGERSPTQCLIKWQAMLKEANGRYDVKKWKWKLIDSKILASRLEKETGALEKDDFTEVRLSSLRSPSWLMEPGRMLHKWKSLVQKYVSPTADYKTNFRSNLQSIKYGLEKVQDEKMARKRDRKQKEDLIDSDEEAK